jgi:uncharacterized SAM-binding protein YcdF (DUF218 family)
LVAAILLLIIFSNPLLFNQFAKIWDIPPYKPDGKKYSCVIVLGGFSSGESKGKGYFSFSADRFIQGVKSLNRKQASHILITGGTGSLLSDEYKEAEWANKQLQEFGIPDSVILIENDSRNTKENAKFSKTLLEKSKLPPPYLLVTSAFHMRRSLMIFKNAGINVVPYPANYIASRRFVITDFIPEASILFYWNIYIKEVIGYIANSI